MKHVKMNFLTFCMFPTTPLGTWKDWHLTFTAIKMYLFNPDFSLHIIFASSFS